MPVTYYRQTDPRWSRNRIGLSWCRIGNAGCVATNLAMLATYIGSPMTPAQVASQKTWFIAGKIIWQMIKIPHLKFVRREYGRNNANIIEAIKGDPDTFVFLQIKSRFIREHWMWAIGVIDDGRSYWVADPLRGDRCDIIARYGNCITGAAYFKKI